MNQEKIGKFIARCRKEKKLTQEQLAEKLGVTSKSISRWENGNTMPDLSLFNPLCEMLQITVNDLMSGEFVDNNNSVNTLGENLINMVSELEIKKKKRIRILFLVLVLISVIFVSVLCFYNYYEIDIKYDKRVMSCDINDKEIKFYINGQSVWKTNYTVRKFDDESLYFFHSTINVYNKRRSNWEYSESMANLIDYKEIPFSSEYQLDIEDESIKVYYTDSSIREIDKADYKKLQNIISKSHLMCEKN